MYPSINDTNNGDEWILLINEDSSQSIGIDSYSTTPSTTPSTRTATSSDNSFNSDDALALRILDDTYDFEAQKPFVLAYPIEDNNCCYDKTIANCTFKRDITGYVFILGVWIFMGTILYILSRL
jgi:hypothetical protein